jgi:hypothetical protein
LPLPTHQDLPAAAIQLSVDDLGWNWKHTAMLDGWEFDDVSGKFTHKWLEEHNMEDIMNL